MTDDEYRAAMIDLLKGRLDADRARALQEYARMRREREDKALRDKSGGEE
jgi:hypothetical protein